MMVTLQSATPSYSAQAADAVRQRSLLADVEEFSYRRAAATITRAIGRMPADVRLKRVIAGKAKLESAKAPQSSSRRAAPLSRVTGRPSGSAALPAHAACPKAPSSPHGSHSGSSASGSTTYFSVASLPSSQGPASAGKGAAPGGGSGACFEV